MMLNPSSRPQIYSRRWLLARLAAVPAIAAATRIAWAEAETAPSALDQMLNVMDFEPVARAAMPPAHWGYLATGVDDDRTVAINHEAFSQVEIRARRFVDVSKVDLSVSMFGVTHPSPVYLSSVSHQRAFSPVEGEIGTARAAAARSALMLLSNVASTGVEDVTEARGGPVWMQLYATDDWEVTKSIVKRAERAGCPAIAFTVDNMPGRNNETLLRAMREDKRVCTSCHVNNSRDPLRAPMYQGIDVSRVKELSPSALSWDYLDRLRDLVSVKLLIKGIVTGEDAAGCVEHGADGIIVSNHGGRNEETLRASIACLPEVAAAVAGRVPVLVDGGVRRGTDVFKALALGATAVGIGRPQAWGLAAFGQKGVEAVLAIYDRELRVIMRQAGTPDTASIRSGSVISHLA
jgi:isopentenyl diphosphate isomerase/L-lactate dehydrogenase-like FMN-dependent dehydrogenase